MDAGITIAATYEKVAPPLDGFPVELIVVDVALIVVEMLDEFTAIEDRYWVESEIVIEGEAEVEEDVDVDTFNFSSEIESP